MSHSERCQVVMSCSERCRVPAEQFRAAVSGDGSLCAMIGGAERPPVSGDELVRTGTSFSERCRVVMSGSERCGVLQARFRTAVRGVGPLCAVIGGAEAPVSDPPSPSFNIPPHPSPPLPTPLERQAESTDLIAYGLIPEFVGRFPVLVGLHALTEEQLVQVLLKPKNALSKQFAKLLAMNNARLHMTEGAVRAIARRAAARNTGARGLRSLLEGLLTEAMYEVPSNLVEAVVLDEASVGHEGEEGEEGKPVPSSLVKAVVLDKASVGHEGEEGGDGVPSSLVEAVVLDEASVGHEGEEGEDGVPGCGAHILQGEGSWERWLQDNEGGGEKAGGKGEEGQGGGSKGGSSGGGGSDEESDAAPALATATAA
ncbi:unnamed protein product [Closterium sp. NIES-65]|nr:unnamed protein product [Closterium sp. NIES-65]